MYYLAIQLTHFSIAMVDYSCKRCGSKVCSKQALIRHLQRKRVCDPTVTDLDVAVLLNEVLSSTARSLKKYECKFCHKLFAFSSNMYTHHKICKQMHTPSSTNSEPSQPHDELTLKEEVKQLRAEISKLIALQQTNASISTTPVQYHTTNNIQIMQTNNIQLNSFGKESLEHITKPFLKECLLKTNDGIRELLKEVHFGENAPIENNNVRVKNFGKRNCFVEIVDNNGKWVVSDKDDTIHTMFRNGYKILWECFMDTQKNNDKEVLEREEALSAWFADIGDVTSKRYYKAKRDIYVLIYNNTLYVLGKAKAGTIVPTS